MLCSVPLCDAMLCVAMLCDAILHYATPRHAMTYYALRCSSTLCYAVLYHASRTFLLLLLFLLRLLTPSQRTLPPTIHSTPLLRPAHCSLQPTVPSSPLLTPAHCSLHDARILETVSQYRSVSRSPERARSWRCNLAASYVNHVCELWVLCSRMRVLSLRREDPRDCATISLCLSLPREVTQLAL